MSAALAFGTDGWRDVIAEGFTFANLARAAQAYAEHLLAAGETRVLVGYDTRFLGATFARRAAEVLAANGLEVLLAPRYLPTPAFSFAVKHLRAGGGVMLTASHNPPEYQGFKLKGAYGGTASDATYRDVERRAAAIGPAEVAAFDARRHEIGSFEVREAYYDALAGLVDTELLRRFGGTLLHEAMGGAATGWLAGFFDWLGAPGRVLELHPEPDPLFCGVNPEPIALNLAAARARAHEASLVVATDGDGDRLGAVLSDGSFFNAHQIFAVLLEHLVAKGQRGAVVKTFTVSRVVERLAAARGLAVRETPVGFKYVAAEMRAGGVLLGGEESGGIGVAGHLPERDGLANALLLLESVLASGQGLAERFRAIEAATGWRHAYDRRDLRLAPGVKEAVLRALEQPPARFAGREVASLERLDGVKLNLAGQAWLMFRASGTEPLLRLYCEAASPSEVEALLDGAEAFVARCAKPRPVAPSGGLERARE